MRGVLSPSTTTPSKAPSNGDSADPVVELVRALIDTTEEYVAVVRATSHLARQAVTPLLPEADRTVLLHSLLVREEALRRRRAEIINGLVVDGQRPLRIAPA